MIRQDLQELGDRQAGPAVDEIEDTMVGAPEAVSLEQSVGVADKIAVGEEEKLDQFVHWRFVAVGGRREIGGFGRHRVH